MAEKMKKVVVSGIPDDVTWERVKYFFANKHRGGPVIKVELYQENKKAIITFQSHTVAKRVVNKGTFDLKESNKIYTLTVLHYEIYQKAVIIEGLPNRADKDSIKSIIEDLGVKCNVIDNICLDWLDNSPLVSFHDMQDVKYILSQNSFKYHDHIIHILPCTLQAQKQQLKQRLEQMIIKESQASNVENSVCVPQVETNNLSPSFGRVSTPIDYESRSKENRHSKIDKSQPSMINNKAEHPSANDLHHMMERHEPHIPEPAVQGMTQVPNEDHPIRRHVEKEMGTNIVSVDTEESVKMGDNEKSKEDDVNDSMLMPEELKCSNYDKGITNEIKEHTEEKQSSTEPGEKTQSSTEVLLATEGRSNTSRNVADIAEEFIDTFLCDGPPFIEYAYYNPIGPEIVIGIDSSEESKAKEFIDGICSKMPTIKYVKIRPVLKDKPSLFLKDDDVLLVKTDNEERNPNHPRYNSKLGTGSLITEANMSQIIQILEDFNMKEVDDVRRAYKNSPYGTLTCFAKDESDRIFAITVHHTFSKYSGSVGVGKLSYKYVLSDIHLQYLGEESLEVRSIAMLSTKYGGVLGVYKSEDGDKKHRAVDIAIMPISHTLIEGHIPKLTDPLDIIEPTQGLQIEKKGAITGTRQGIITHPRYMAKVNPTDKHYPQKGYMFGVVGQHFAESGDSGSLVYFKDPSGRRKVVGILQQYDESYQSGSEKGLFLCVRMDYCLEYITKLFKKTLRLYDTELTPVLTLHNRYHPSQQDIDYVREIMTFVNPFVEDIMMSVYDCLRS